MTRPVSPILNRSVLPALREFLPTPQPRADRHDRSIKRIVHIGVGAFHRAHQAFILQQLHNRSICLDWEILGLSLRPEDRPIFLSMSAQGSVYTLVSCGADGTEQHEIIGAITDILFAPDDPDQAVAALADARTKIISLTITEGGYLIDPNCGRFQLEDAGVQHDLQCADPPLSVYGYLAAGLSERKKLRSGPVTLLSCDNLPNNGAVLRNGLLAFVREKSPELAEWIEVNVSFPGTMVDRITPVRDPSLSARLEQQFGYCDAIPVNCEPFFQWVMEDDFVAGRPEFEEVGAQFTNAIPDYEKIKLRILNAGHSLLGILGALHGFERIDQCALDLRLQGLLRTFLKAEAAPVLQPPEGIDLDEYIETTIRRFTNAHIKDSTGRICSQSSAKIPKFILPTIAANLSANGPIEVSAFLIAAWREYHFRSVDEKGAIIDREDAMSAALKMAAQSASLDPLAFLRIEEVFGDLAQNERFAACYLEFQNDFKRPDGVLQIAQRLIA